MTILKKLSYLVALSLLILSACKKDKDTSITDNSNYNPPTKVAIIPEENITSSIRGTIVDEGEIPMENVTVRVGSHQTQSDVNGSFAFENIQMNKNGTLVYVDKAGYYYNGKVVTANPNRTTITKLMLIEQVLSSSFASSVGGTTELTDGAKVDIPANAVSLESGGAYNGTVKVYATWLDPTADDLTQRMPGDLRAQDENEDAVKLVTYGMIGVELKGINDEDLNLVEGQTATIELPVPDELLSDAPATIPLWHFNETTGYWVEEGEATLLGNTYVGTVSHFSFWNVDWPYPLVEIEGYVTNEGQTNLSGVGVEITLTSGGMGGYQQTDSDGWYGGYVPQNEDLILTLYDNCGVELHSQQIGPFSDNTVIPTIAIPLSNSSLVNITGTLQDCNNNAEDDGYALIEFDNGYEPIYPSSDGNFNGTISVCNALSVTVSGISFNPFSQGTTTVHDIEGISDLDVGTLTTCW